MRKWTKESDIEMIAASFGWESTLGLDNSMPGVSWAGVYDSHDGLRDTKQALVLIFASVFSSALRALKMLRF